MGLGHSHEEPEPLRDTNGQCHLLVIALDYDYVPGSELTCTKDASVMVGIVERAGVTDITVVTDKNTLGQPCFPTREVILRHIRKVGQRCRPGDWFIFFYAGHGVNVVDCDGDEADGFDEAFVTPSNDGKLLDKAVLLDDDFAKALDVSIPLETRILCICDCCHSGTIVDIDSFHFRHNIYSISASQDHEEAEDTKRGGVLTQALKTAIQHLTLKHGESFYSLKKVVDKCRKVSRSITQEQEMSFQFAGEPPQQVAWPLRFRRRELLQKGISSPIAHSPDDSESDGSENSEVC